MFVSINVLKHLTDRIMYMFCENILYNLLVQGAERVCRRCVHLGGLVGQSGYQPRVVLQLNSSGNCHFLCVFGLLELWDSIGFIIFFIIQKSIDSESISLSISFSAWEKFSAYVRTIIDCEIPFDLFFPLSLFGCQNTVTIRHKDYKEMCPEIAWQPF